MKTVIEPEKVIPARERPQTLRESLREHEAERLTEALVAAKGNKSEAARLLGLERRSFYRKLAAYERRAKASQAEAS